MLTFLTLLEFKRGDRILGMQRFMLDKVQAELARLRRREKHLCMSRQCRGASKIHQAVAAIVEAPDIHALNSLVRTKLPALLDPESAVLCIEETGALALAGANPIGAGGIANLLGRKQRVLLQKKRPASR